MSELVKALAAAKKQFKPVVKNQIAKIPTKSGGEYSYKYADLSDLLDCVTTALSEHELVLLQPTGFVDGQFCLITKLKHSSGEEEISYYPLPNPVGIDAKTMGSHITYARRYEVSTILGIASEDDDGDRAVAVSKPAKQNGSRPAQPAKVDINQKIADLFRQLGYEPHAASEFIKKHFGGKSKRSELSSDELQALHDLLLIELDPIPNMPFEAHGEKGEH